MTRARSNWSLAGGRRVTLVIAGAVSLGLHAWAGYALGLLPASGPEQRERDPREPPPFEPDVPYAMLGEREGSPLSISWIALPEPENHTAVERSQTTQPLLRTEAAAPVKGPETNQTGPGEAAQALDERAIRVITARAQALQVEVIERASERASAILRTPARFLDLLASARPAEAPDRDRAEAAQTTPAQEPERAQAPGGGAETAAPETKVSDRESDPSSTIEAVVDDIGSDLTSEGLKLRTFRPVIPPGVPPAKGVVDFEIAFDATGKAYARIVNPSANGQWDQIYKNVIYQKWTASGPAIERLEGEGPDARVRVRLRISYENLRR